MTQWELHREMAHKDYTDAMNRLQERLPAFGGAMLRYFADSSPWVRIPPALALIVGGTLGFLPILGFWMVPLGLVLIAQDVPLLRGPIGRAILWADRRWSGKPVR